MKSDKEKVLSERVALLEELVSVLILTSAHGSHRTDIRAMIAQVFRTGMPVHNKNLREVARIVHKAAESNRNQ